MSGKLMSGVFSEDFVYLSPEAARVFIEKKLGLVGIDYVSIDESNSGDVASLGFLKVSDVACCTAGNCGT